MAAPQHLNRSPSQILDEKAHFTSSWYVWKSLAWLDYSKRNTNVSALQYSAFELRQGIEQLWFDIITTLDGGRLNIREYSRCKQDATKMYKVIQRLQPDYHKLVRFTNICGSLDPKMPRVVEWDMSRLMRVHGEIAEYLHFYGIPTETTENPVWFIKALTTIETGANYIWQQLTTARVGQMNAKLMEPEVRDAWDQFKTNNISEDVVRMRLSIAQPILHNRRVNHQSRNSG